MPNHSQDKFTTVEVVYLIIAFAVVAASLGLVITRLDNPPTEITADFSSFNGGYDVSVLNSATADDFIHVHGIGEVKARAIISYRDSLGEFTDIYQLLDLKTITPQNFEDIVSYFYLGGNLSEDINEIPKESTPHKDEDKEKEEIISSTTEGEEPTSSDSRTDNVNIRRAVNINYASAVEISEYLLIEIERAEQIVAMRELLGGFNNIQEVLLCDLITEDIYAQIKPYLLLE